MTGQLKNEHRTFNLFAVPTMCSFTRGVSIAAGLKSGQFDRKKNCAVYFPLDTLRPIA